MVFLIAMKLNDKTKGWRCTTNPEEKREAWMKTQFVNDAGLVNQLLPYSVFCLMTRLSFPFVDLTTTVMPRKVPR